MLKTIIFFNLFIVFIIIMISSSAARSSAFESAFTNIVGASEPATCEQKVVSIFVMTRANTSVTIFVAAGPTCFQILPALSIRHHHPIMVLSIQAN
ncbi:hypothetical protein WN944_014154 [Citrus x changshan-huyou]|uniref:Uncharacterized protein n=1 Tax=Citrus x changshan-huyou TaxID=2935761 RepID=A0AAP0QPT2_9ROSI